ncbi:MAG: tetratricopeptide repeat protein [Myxococcota bacterium]|nr:tetratricopeptide repeat protein [Myxococcota bacterium]
MKLPATVYYVDFRGLHPGIIGRRQSANKETRNRSKRVAASSDTNTSKEAGLAPGRLMSGQYSRKEVSRFFGMTEGRLQYWDRSGFLSPTGHNGRRRCYTFQDLVGIRSAKTLLDRGISVRKVRQILDRLRNKLPNSPHPIDRLRIMSDTKQVIVIDADREFEADTGQLLLDFHVNELRQEIVAELPAKRYENKERSAYEWYLEGCRLDEDESTIAKAEEAYHKAIHLDPTLATAYTNLGNVMYRRGAVEDARTLYQKAIEVDEQQPEAHYNLGFLEFEAGQLEAAEHCFTRALHLDSTFADAHFNVAMTLLRLGKVDRARHHLQSYLAAEPNGAWADIARKRLENINY